MIFSLSTAIATSKIDKAMDYFCQFYFNNYLYDIVTYGYLGAPGIGEHPPGGLDRTTDHLPDRSTGRTIAGATPPPPILCHQVVLTVYLRLYGV